MASFDPSRDPPLSEPRRLLVGIITVHLLWFEVAFSQRAHGVFGASIGLPLTRTPAGLFISPGPTGPEINLVTNNPPGIDAYILAERGKLEYRSTTPLKGHCRFWERAGLDAHGTPALVGLTTNSDTLIIARRRGAAGYDEMHIHLDARPQRLLLADMDNDRQSEILLFGKSMAGIQLIKKRPNGSYVSREVLFPDVSASDVAVTDLNGDGIPDLFIANWLTNQVAVSFGIARYVFSEQVTIDLEAEPGALTLTPVTRRRALRLAVLMPGAKAIAVFTGNGAGEFRRTATIACPLTPQQAEFKDLNGDGLPDLVVAGEKGLQTIIARSATAFESAVVYGVGNVVDHWQVADLGGDRRGELVCADRRGRRLIVSSRGVAGSGPPSPATYLAGERPQGLILADVNNDGFRDIVVANEGSSSLSCYLNNGTGDFAPQVTIGTAEKPSILRPVDGDPRTFLVAHRGEGKLSVVSTATWENPSVFSIPTAADPVVLRALQRRREDPLRILVSSRGGAQQSATFSLFEQLTGRNFLERTFTTVLPTAFRGIATASVIGGNGTDLLFLTADRSGRKYTLSCASAGEDFGYGTVQALLSFTDSTASFRAVQAADVDGDGFEDVLIAGHGQGKGVGVLYAQGGGTFDPAIHWIGGLANSGGPILIEDLDGDSIPDCAVIDHSTRTVRVVYGEGGRRFSSPRDAAPAAGASSFDIGPLIDRGSRDLVLTNEGEGTISVFHNPFSR